MKVENEQTATHREPGRILNPFGRRPSQIRWAARLGTVLPRLLVVLRWDVLWLSSRAAAAGLSTMPIEPGVPTSHLCQPQSVSSRKLQPCVRSVVSSITLVRAIAFNVHITCRRHGLPATTRSSTFDRSGAHLRRKGYSRRCVF